MRIGLAAISAAALTVAACQSTADRADAEQRAAELRAVQERIAAYQGEEVGNVCFTRGRITGWRPLGPGAVLVNRGVDDWYKLDLTGFCSSRQDFDAIALGVEPGRSCLSPGDRLAVSDFARTSSCMVSAIHVWNEPAHETP